MNYSNVIKEKRILCCAIVAILLLLSSCHQNIMLMGKEKGSGLEIMVANFSSGSARTIAPSQIPVSDLQNPNMYQLKLSGTTGRMSFAERAITFTNGRATLLDISPGLWELTLSAYNTRNVKMLEGKATVQVRSVGQATVTFVLEPVTTGTGTINVTLNMNRQDVLVLNQGGNSVTRSLLIRMTNLDGSTVSGTQAVGQVNTTLSLNENTVVSLTYVGGLNSVNIPAGEYKILFQMWGGGIPAGTTATWSDNLYVEPGRETRATVNLPQLLTPPRAPTRLTATTTTEANGKYDITFNVQGGNIYNNDGYELEVMKYTSNNTNGNVPLSDAEWNGYRSQSGSVVNNFTTKNLGYVKPEFLYKAGGLTKTDSGVTFNVTRNNAHYFARVRTTNSTGSSPWVYLPYLAMPGVTITGHNSTGTYLHHGYLTVWDVTLNLNQSAWGNNYEVSWLRLNSNDSLSNYIYDDAKWLAYQATDRQGTRTYGKANSVIVDQLDNNKKFVFRIRTVSSIGKSDWFYYTQETRQR